MSEKALTVDKLSVFDAVSGSYYAMIWLKGRPQVELLLSVVKVRCDPEKCSRRHSWDQK